MEVAFDIDGVVLRSIELILDVINKRSGTSLTPDDLTTWDLEPLGIEPHVLTEAVEYMFSAKKIAPYAGAVKTLSTIYKITRKPILFITGRSDPGTAARQLEALDWNPHPPEMIVIGGNRDKRVYLAESDARFIIEDDLLYLPEYLNQGIGVGLMVRPWNHMTDIPVDAKFHSWDEIGDWFIENFGNGNSRKISSFQGT